MKKGKRMLLYFFWGISFIVSGCASVVNPYKGEFECPQMEKGKCVGIKEAYEESLRQGGNSTGLSNYYPKLEEGKFLSSEAMPEEQKAYADALFNKLNKVLKDPETPILVSPQVVRVLILPYKDDNGKTLFFSRYVYVIVEEPRWIFDNILTETGENE